MNTIFPRSDDKKGWAWGLKGNQPEEPWERFSKAYERHAQLLLTALAKRWPVVALDWAGSEDGEAAVARLQDGTLQFSYHLEDPGTAKRLADAIAEDRLDEFIRAIEESTASARHPPAVE